MFIEGLELCKKCVVMNVVCQFLASCLCYWAAYLIQMH